MNIKPTTNDHGRLTGLTDDDHTQYATNTEFDDHNARHEPGGGDAMAVDAAAATGSLRTLGTGAAQAATGNHTHAAASTWQLVGTAEAEVTYNATTGAQDLIVVSGLSIPTNRWILIQFIARKTSGAADNVSFGIKLNATLVAATSTTAQTNIAAWSSRAVDEAEPAGVTCLYGPRNNSNILKNGIGSHAAYGSTGDIGQNFCNWNANQPQATITSITIVAKTDNTLITVAASNVEVYMSVP